MKSFYAAAAVACVLGGISVPQDAKATTYDYGTYSVTITKSQTLPSYSNPSTPYFSGTYNPSTNVNTPDYQLNPWGPTSTNDFSVLDSNYSADVNPSDAIYNQATGTETFSILWGSPDTYNYVELFTAGFGNGSLIGQIYNPANLTDYTAGAGYDYVTFTIASLGGPVPSIGSVELVNDGTPAFEYAAVTLGGSTDVAQTPLPAALPLFAGGLAMIGLSAGGESDDSIPLLLLRRP